MVETEDRQQSVGAVLRDHVVSPLSTAQDILDLEYEEVTAERDAFGKFRDRVAGIETVSTRRTGPATRTYANQPRSRAVERVRAAFRETVMSVDHYEETYGETLVEHASAELSADLATGLQGNAGTPFTDAYRETLVAAAGDAVDQRERFLETLETERESLEDMRDTLGELLDSVDGPHVPEYHRAEFDQRLTDIAEARQETIRTHHFPARVDGHDLCQYLYRGPEWTYPVLTAVTRLRDLTD